MAEAAELMGRSMPAGILHELMAASHDAARWDDVAARCLTCGNCTMACPTCFCTGVDDVTDLSGEHAERWQHWDSCFDLDFSHLHGGPVRSSPTSRYRQWLTHKLGTWHDQFGSSGCVGCGRCIVWCPVGIDLTEEVAALRPRHGGRHRGAGGIAVSGVAPGDLAGHGFLRGLPDRHVALLAGAASLVSFRRGHRLFEEGGPASRLWLIRSGHVALDLHVPGRAAADRRDPRQR